MTTPTVGRIVHFWRSYQPDVEDDAQPFAAIVTRVHDHALVDLQVFGYGEDDAPHQFHAASVRLQQEGMEPPAQGEAFCVWPARV